MKTILVLGGTGKTGSRVAQRLEARGVPVRLGSRSGEPPFDWDDHATWAPALEGVDALYASYYPDLAVPGAAATVGTLARFAVASGVSRVVLLSGRGEEEAQRAEEAVRESGADWTIVRCSWFAQNFTESFMLEPVLAGEAALPAGDVPEPFVDVDDIADVAVAALTDDRHIGQEYELTGPRLLTFADALAEISKAAGRTIEYVPITSEQFSAAMRAEQVPEDFRWLLSYLFSEVLDGRNASVTDGVQQALGRAPRDFSDFAREAAATGVWDAPTTARGADPVETLRATFDGQLITPGDSGYDLARAVVYGGWDRHPAVIVRPTDAAGVGRVVSAARETGLELAVRGGGHSNAGHSTTEGGIVLDLSAMKALDIDPQSRTAWAETGLTAGEYTAAAGVYGLATGFGDAGSVGIGGITLGGGIGFLVRKHGLTIDSLLAAEVVTADGEVRRVDAETNPDLFWAIRGGGGNFGVATRLQFRLHPVDTVVGGMLLLPATAEVIAGFVAEAEAAPEELSAIANVMPAPPMPFLPAEWHGRLVVMAQLVYAGDLEAGQRAVDRLRALAPPLADLVQPMPYPQMFPPEEGGYHPTAVAHTMFLDAIGGAEAETILDHLLASDASMRVAQLRVLGGAMGRVPDEATAFAHRGSRIMANLAAFYDGAEDRVTRKDWVDGFAAALRQSDPGAYVNFLGDEGPARVRQAYPAGTWERLVAAKHRWDPTNLFRLNQNIPPAAERGLAAPNSAEER